MSRGLDHPILPNNFLVAPEGRVHTLKKDSRFIHYRVTLFVDGIRNRRLGFTLINLCGFATVHSLTSPVVLSPTSSSSPRSPPLLSSLAERAGIRIGDQILAAHGHEFDDSFSSDDVVDIINEHKPYVQLTIRRDRTHFNPQYIIAHPLAEALSTTHSMLDPKDIFAVSAFITRVKLRTLQWATGLISRRAETLLRDYVTELSLKDGFKLTEGDKIADDFDPVAIRQVFHYQNSEGVFAAGDVVLDTSSLRRCISVRIDACYPPSKVSLSGKQRSRRSSTTIRAAVFRICCTDVSSGVNWEVDRDQQQLTAFGEQVCQFVGFSQLEFPVALEGAFQRQDNDEYYYRRGRELQVFFSRVLGTAATLTLPESADANVRVHTKRASAPNPKLTEVNTGSSLAHVLPLIHRFTEAPGGISINVIPSPRGLSECFVYSVLSMPTLQVVVEDVAEDTVSRCLALHKSGSQNNEDDILTILNDVSQFIARLRELLEDNLKNDIIGMTALYRNKEEDDEIDEENHRGMSLSSSFDKFAAAINSPVCTSAQRQAHRGVVSSSELNIKGTTILSDTERDEVTQALRQAREDRKLLIYEKSMDLLSMAVQRQVESTMFPRVSPTYLPILRRHLSAQTAKLMDCYARLRDKPQEFFAIDLRIGGQEVSWESAILRLKWLNSIHLPLARAEAVADTLDLIPLIYQQAATKCQRRMNSAVGNVSAAHIRCDGDGITVTADTTVRPQEFDTASTTSFTADLLIPIFLYIVTQAAIPDLLLIRHEMQISTHSGRADYALATLDAALEAIMSM